MVSKSKINKAVYNDRRRKLYHERKSKGLCPRCGKPSKGKRVFCKACRKYDRDQRAINADSRNTAARAAYRRRKEKKTKVFD